MSVLGENGWERGSKVDKIRTIECASERQRIREREFRDGHT